MAKIRFEIEFPTLRVDDLVALVVANDATHDDEPIDRHVVTGADVLSLWFQGDFPILGEATMKRVNGVMLVGNEIVHVNEMQD